MVKTKEVFSSKLVLILVSILIIIGVVFAIYITGMGPTVIDGLSYWLVTQLFWNAIVPWMTNIYTWVTAIALGTVAFFVTQRKKIFAKDRGQVVSVTTPNLQSSLVNTQPFQSVNTGTVVVPAKKDEVVVSS